MVPSHTDLTMATASNSEQTIEIHKLKNKWNLWAHLPQDPDWTVKSYKKIYQFKTIEEAVGITEMLPEGLVKNCMLFIMKDGITPMWEDPKNRNGGCFSYKVSNKNVFEVWRDLTYVLIGESLSANATFVNSVTGITISPKKNFCIVKVWMTNCEHQNPQVVTGDIKNLIPQGCLFKKHTPEF
jgi:hypothetical protein